MCSLRSRRRRERREAEVSLLPYVVPVALFFSELPSYLHLSLPPSYWNLPRRTTQLRR